MARRTGADRAQRILDFLAEAKRRKVYISVVAYIAVAIGAVELGNAITQALELPPATTQVLTILLLLGFPVVVVLAWIFDITTAGVVRTGPRARAGRTRRRLAAALGRAAPAPAALPQVRQPGVRARDGAAPADDAAADPDPERLHRAALAHLRHELRTPVNAIIGYAEMLLEDAADPTLEADLKRIRAGGRDLLVQIERLIGADRGEAGTERDAAAFAARAHAELRTPVTTVLGYAELLGETCRERGRDELIPDLERIAAAARRVLESSAGIVDAAGAAAESLDAETAAITRDVLVRIRPVEPGVLAVEGEGRILVVDDNAMNRDLLLRQLARSGYIVDTASDGVEALERLAERDYDLILLDVLMPRMDGVATLTRIRADDRLQDVPVLMLSSLDEVDSALRCIELGAEEYLTKPFQPTLLAARIAASIALRRLRVRDRAWSEHVAGVTSMLCGVFPDDIAARVLRGERRIMQESAAATAIACVLPRQARSRPAAELVGLLEELEEAVGETAEAHAMDAVVMLPHGALLVAGLAAGGRQHAASAIGAALQLLRRVPRCAAGLHTGPAAAGVIGSRRLQYGVWGEAAATAESLANEAPAGTAIVSPVTHAMVRDAHLLAAGPVTEVPGHGHMRTWLLRALAEPAHR